MANLFRPGRFWAYAAAWCVVALALFSPDVSTNTQRAMKALERKLSRVSDREKELVLEIKHLRDALQALRVAAEDLEHPRTTVPPTTTLDPSVKLRAAADDHAALEEFVTTKVRITR